MRAYFYGDMLSNQPATVLTTLRNIPGVLAADLMLDHPTETVVLIEYSGSNEYDEIERALRAVEGVSFRKVRVAVPLG